MKRGLTQAKFNVFMVVLCRGTIIHGSLALKRRPAHYSITVSTSFQHESVLTHFATQPDLKQDVPVSQP